MNQHLMLDLETLSLRPDSVLLSIGLVPFSLEDGVKEGIEIVLDLEQQVGRRIDQGTVTWWIHQSLEAKKVFAAQRISNDLAMREIHDFIQKETVGPKNVKMWGNGSDFDNVLFGNWWNWGKVRWPGTPDIPWQFYNNRCFRTLKNLHPSFEGIMKGVQRVVHHNALDDARWQAECAVRMLRQIN